jgi:hypothetical protein
MTPDGVKPRSVGLTYVVVAELADSRVEAWSSTRLPFEPQTGAMREFRGELRSAVAQLSASPAKGLYALYVSYIGGHFDVENVLLYNVGPSAFLRSAAFELVVERALGPVPSPPAGLTQARHHYRYETMPIDTPWRRWSAIRSIASFGPVDLGPSAQARRPSRVWYAVRRSGPEVSRPAGVPSAFGLDLVLEAPANVSVNLAAIAKPLVDGVAAAFHAHDDPASIGHVASRVAAQLGAPVDEVRSLLGQNRTAILGGRRLLWPWREGVQWNPADDLCAAFRIRRVTRAAAGGDSDTWRLHGSIAEIEPV